MGVRATSLKDRVRTALPARAYYALRAPVQLLPSRSGPAAARRRRRRLLTAVRSGHGSVVQGGPFQGMRYVRLVSWGEVAPKLLGSYEAELHAALEQLIARKHRRVVNVGCAEGYYAVGLARRLPGATVFAFDSDPYAQHLCRRLAARNRVAHRVRVEGTCSAGRLRELVTDPTLLVIDCEGCELELLQPDLVPALAAADILVELHDFIDPSISSTMLRRFSDSHEITLVDSTERDPGAYRVLDRLANDDRMEAVAEHRPGVMQWAVMRPKAGLAEGGPASSSFPT